MTNLTKLKYINKGKQMEIIKNEISVKLTKTNVSDLVAEALQAGDTSGIKRVLQPLLQGSFTQCPNFSIARIDGINPDGTMDVTYKVANKGGSAVEENSCRQCDCKEEGCDHEVDNEGHCECPQEDCSVNTEGNGNDK